MMQFKQSAPGSIMLLGEYAVLHHGHALVCAIDKRVHVQLTPRTDETIEIISTLGKYQTTLGQLEIIAPFQFVLAAIKARQPQLQQGFTLTIESEFSDQMGLASSAAVTVATLAVIAMWLQVALSPLQLIEQARQVVQAVQGMGSGADVAACVLGGVVAYRREPLMAEKISESCPLNLIYSGSKIPTPVVVKQVETRFVDHPEIYQQLLQSIDVCAQQGIAALKNQNLSALGRAMTIQQGLMQALGVNTPLLQGIVEEMLSTPDVLGAKISGSGLGDCVVALGALRHHDMTRFAAQGIKQIPIAVVTEGVRCEKI